MPLESIFLLLSKNYKKRKILHTYVKTVLEKKTVLETKKYSAKTLI